MSKVEQKVKVKHWYFAENNTSHYHISLQGDLLWATVGMDNIFFQSFTVVYKWDKNCHNGNISTKVDGKLAV